MSPLLPGLENWIPFVALLWLASGGLLAFSALKYFASTAVDRTRGESAAKQPSGGDVVPPRAFVRDALCDDGAGEPQHLAGSYAAPPPASSGHRRIDAGDRNGTAATSDVAPCGGPVEHDAASVREAVRARFARDRASAQGLSELIRALYLDQSNFTFHTIAGLQTEDRALARALIDAWLREPSAVDAWKAVYDTARDAAPRPPEKVLG